MGNYFNENLFSQNSGNNEQIQRNLKYGIKTKKKAIQPRNVPIVYSNKKFEGTCIVTDAAKSLCGLHHAVAYCHDSGTKFSPDHFPVCFRFESTLIKSKGQFRSPSKMEMMHS